MARNWWLAFALVGALSMGGASTTWGGELLSEPELARHGLTRAWFTQVQLDPSVGRIVDVVVDEDKVFVQTDRAVLQVINAETGQTLWTQQVGDPHHPTLTPGVSPRMVAAVNGTTLQVFSRASGRLLWKTALDGAPGAGPALSHERVYVPLTNGMVVSYRLKVADDPSKELGKDQKKTAKSSAKAESKGAKSEKAAKPETESDAAAAKAAAATAKAEAKAAKAQVDLAKEAERLETLGIERGYVAPLQCQSLGRTLTQPLITRQTTDDEFVAWPTDLGYLYICSVNRQDHKYLQLKYRLETRAPIVAQPAYLPPNTKLTGDSGVIFGASQDGFVHAIREKDGQPLWRFSTGEPISRPAVVVGRRVLVTNTLGGMYCLDAKTGSQVWWSPGVVQFMTASRDKVYSADKLGRTVVLDGRTGARLDTIAETEMLPVKPVNLDNDRIYLASKTGLLQCLHETALFSPFVHRLRGPEVEETPAAPSTKTVAGEGEKPRPAGGGGHTAAPASSGAKKSGSKKDLGGEFGGGGKKSGKKGAGAADAAGPGGALGPGPGMAPGGGKRKGKVPKFQ